MSYLSFHFLIAQITVSSHKDSRLNLKRAVRARLGRLFIDTLHFGPSGAFIEQTGQLGEFFLGAYGVDFDASIVQIASVSGEAQFGGRMLGEIPEPDALYPSANEPSARRPSVDCHSAGEDSMAATFHPPAAIQRAST